MARVTWEKSEALLCGTLRGVSFKATSYLGSERWVSGNWEGVVHASRGEADGVEMVVLLALILYRGKGANRQQLNGLAPVALPGHTREAA